MAAITEASRSAGVSGAVRMTHRFALGKGESISVDPGSDSLKAFAVRRQRLKRGAVFGGALLKGLAPHRDWYATEQGLEGHLRLLGNTGSTEFERA